jgi:hypothetical protein
MHFPFQLSTATNFKVAFTRSAQRGGAVMKQIKIRGRDGAIRTVSDNYILRDGETRVVDMPFMDAQGRPIIHNGHGHPAGQRPGFLYSDANEEAEKARIDAYAAYDDAIANRWRRSDQPQTQPQAFDSKEEALAAAYADYQHRICNAWRK